MIGNIKLKPASRSPYVRIRFYGGPRDGEATDCVTASELKGRSGIGCELNPEYIVLAEERIAKAKAKLPLFVS